MSDDALIAGAAAPEGHRWIRSVAVLDAGWVVVASVALIGSSFFALIDLPNQHLRTGGDPLRVFVLGLPVIAIVTAVAGAVRRSVSIVAFATGVVAPGVALAGSLGVSLLLDDASAFADGGVAISVIAALLGIALLIRWWVYHPLPLMGDQSRPVPIAGRALLVCSTVITAIQVVTTVAGDTAWSAAAVGQTLLLLVVAFVVLAAGAMRTIAAAWLATGACSSQVVAVVVAKVERSTLPWDSDLLLRTGVAGLAALVVTTVVAVAAAMGAAPDPEPEGRADDTESWRWEADD